MYDSQTFFQTYLRNTSEKKEFVKRLGERFQWERLRPIHLADLGCHDGTLTLQYLNAVESKLGPGSTLTCVDPSAAALGEFKSKVLPKNLQAVFFESTAEHFCTTQPLHFDWIIASHCFYWSNPLEKILKNVIPIGRKIAVVLRGPKGIFQIQSTFRHLLGNDKEQLYTSTDVERALTLLNVAFERENFLSEINIPSYSDPAFPFLVSFFLQTTPEKLLRSQLDSVAAFLDPYGAKFPHQVTFFWISNL